MDQTTPPAPLIPAIIDTSHGARLLTSRYALVDVVGTAGLAWWWPIWNGSVWKSFAAWVVLGELAHWLAGVRTPLLDQLLEALPKKKTGGCGCQGGDVRN